MRFRPVGYWRDVVHQDVGTDGLKVKEDSVEHAAPEVLSGKAAGRREEGDRVVDEKEHGRNLHSQ